MNPAMYMQRKKKPALAFVLSEVALLTDPFDGRNHLEPELLVRRRPAGLEGDPRGFPDHTAKHVEGTANLEKDKSGTPIDRRLNRLSLLHKARETLHRSRRRFRDCPWGEGPSSPL